MRAPTYVPEGSDVLADASRRLVDAVVRTQVSPDDVAAAARSVDAVTASLSGDLREGPYTPDLTDPFGNPVSLVTGPTHPYAPPVRIEAGPDGATARFRLGSTYEGPPGLVHDVVSVNGRKISLIGSVRAGDTTTVTARGLFLALDREKAAALFPHLAAG